MSLEGPAFVLRWRDAAHDDASGVIAPERIEIVAELPYQLHVDHPEGIDLWPEAGAGVLLVIYDAPAPERTDPDTFTVRADLIGPQVSKACSRAWHITGNTTAQSPGHGPAVPDHSEGSPRELKCLPK